MSACCAASADAKLRLTPFDCFQRGLATRRLPPLALAGPRVTAPGGFWAEFSLRLRHGRIAELRFSCASCTTLIACCQALVELNHGCAADSVCVLDADALWALLPGVPHDKRDRVALGVAALRAALRQIQKPALLRTQEPVRCALPESVVPAKAGTQGVCVAPDEVTGSPPSRG